MCAKYYAVALLFLAPLLMAPDITVTVPSAAVPDLQLACQRLADNLDARAYTNGTDPDTMTNGECGAELIKMGYKHLVVIEVREQAEVNARSTINADQICGRAGRHPRDKVLKEPIRLIMTEF